jgi:hypothetical protein
MAFKAQHRMALNPDTTRKFWNKLFAAAQAGQRNAVGYTYAVASKGSPEPLTIWHDGRIVLRSLGNTGIPVAPTASGTFPSTRAGMVLPHLRQPGHRYRLTFIS